MRTGTRLLQTGLLIFLFILVAACARKPAPPSSSRKPATRTPHPTEAPAQKPDPTAKATTPPAAKAQPTPETIQKAAGRSIYLPDEIIYSFLGGGGAGCGTRYNFGEITVPTLPAIVLLNHEGLYKSIGRYGPGFGVCLIGMPLDTSLGIFFSHTQTNFLVFDTFTPISNDVIDWDSEYPVPKDYAGFSSSFEGDSFIEFDVWWEADMPAGEWLIQVVDLGASEVLSEANYNIHPDEAPYIEASLSTTNLYRIHPFGYDDTSLACRYLYSYKTGSTVLLKGINLPKSQTIKLGLYNSKRLLMIEDEITTDQNGEFIYEISPGLTDSGARYFAYTLWDPDFELTEQGLVASGGTDTCFILP